MSSRLLRTHLLVKVFPFFVLFFELAFGFLSGLSSDPRVPLTSFMMLWMVSWWIFEIMPLGVTALIPMVFLPFLGLSPLKEVTPHYAHPVIYLFLGGFIVARALEKTRLSERIALEILKITGKSDRGIVMGFGLATAFLSMWISNTATTVMMVPIAYSVIGFLKENLDATNRASLPEMSVVLYLTIAYSANIGGIMTPVGTPPNVVFVGYLDQLYGIQIDFWKWMLAVVPPALLVLFAMFALLRKLNPYSVTLPDDFPQFIRRKLAELGPLNSKQFVTLAVFSLVAFLWIFKGLIHKVVGIEFLDDSSVAILGGVLLFLIPVRSEDPNSTWSAPLDEKDISFLPWNIVLLFGGGMAMASALKDAGLIQLATDLFASMEIASPWLLIFSLAVMALFLTEIMSNVALCVVALPVVMNLGVASGLSPILVGLPVALCTSFAFMMPVSTPPNAIVFGTGQVRIKQMMRAGLFLNIVSVIIVMTLGWVMVHLLLI